MTRVLVVAHRTLGGEHLRAHLLEVHAADPTCEFHLVVPEYHPFGRAWSSVEAQIQARSALDAVVSRLIESGLAVTGEVGDANPVLAVDEVVRREGEGAFDGIVLSTLPQGLSHWWRSDVAKKLESNYPELPLTHLVGEDPDPDEGG